MDFGKYVDLELGLQLKEKGFDEMCGYTFVNHRRVKDEIKTKYPGLSDCGYDELTKNGVANSKRTKFTDNIRTLIRRISRTLG